MNNGLMIADGIGAGLKTYSQMQGIDADKKMMGLRDAQAKMQADEHAARMRESEQRSKLVDAQIKAQEDENIFRLNALIARKMRSVENAGIEFTPENEQAFNSLNPRARFDFIQSEPVRKSRQIYKDAMQGKISMNSEDAYRAFETIFPEVITGATDGRKVKVNRLVPAKDGSGIYVGLEVTNPDGTVNPNGGLTVGRSADPNAEMRLVTFDQLNRTVGTMEQADNAWSNPKYRKAYMDYYDPQPDNHVSAKDQSIIDKNKAQAALYQSRAKNETTGGAGGGGKLPAEAQMVNFYKAMGYSDDDAIAMANDSASSPEKFVTSYSKMLLETSKDSNGEATISPEQAFEKSMEVYNNNFRRKPGAGKEAPASAIEALKKNPDKKDQFKAKYGYLPENI